MKKIAILCLSILIFGISCVSMPLSQENRDFQNKTGINLTFVARGIYSQAYSHQNQDYGDIYNKLITNNIILSVDEAQEEWATYICEDEIIYITINNLYSKYTNHSNNAFLTSTVFAIGLLSMGYPHEEIEPQFYYIISNYANYGVNVTSIVSDDLFINGDFKIVDNGIIYKASN